MSGLTVSVRLSGALAQQLGSRRSVQLPAGATAETLTAEIACLAGFTGDARGLAVVADGTFLPRDRALADGQQVDVLVPVAGG